MLRKLISRLNKSVSKSVVASRHNYEVPIKLSFKPNRATGRLDMTRQEFSITGETQNLSKTGIGLILSAIRVQEHYLVGEDLPLNAELDLPNGKIKMKIVCKRYEQIGQHISVSRYLIGAHILEMSEDHREAYETFLHLGNKSNKAAGGLTLGIDES